MSLTYTIENMDMILMAKYYTQEMLYLSNQLMRKKLLIANLQYSYIEDTLRVFIVTKSIEINSTINAL